MIRHTKDPMMKQHILSWQSSGQSQRKYCEQHNLRPDMFSYYKKKLCKGIKQLPLQTNQLIPVDILAESPMPPRAVTIQLSHTNGFRLEINPNHDIKHLKPLLELLRSVA